MGVGRHLDRCPGWCSPPPRWLPSCPAALFVTTFGIFAVGETMYAPVLNPLTASLAPSGLVGTTLGMFTALQTGFSAVGPLVAGVILGAGLGSLFIGAARGDQPARGVRRLAAARGDAQPREVAPARSPRAGRPRGLSHAAYRAESLDRDSRRVRAVGPAARRWSSHPSHRHHSRDGSGAAPGSRRAPT